MRAVALLAFVAATASPVWVLEPPLGIELHMPVPAANPLTPEKVTLGEQLFFDTRLSRDGTMSCAGCHQVGKAFSDGRTVARGIGNADGTRNVPSLVNRGYGEAFFWDGRAASLERQAIEPILNPRELGGDKFVRSGEWAGRKVRYRRSRSIRRANIRDQAPTAR